MTSSFLLSLATFFYLCVTGIYLYYLFSGSRKTGRLLRVAVFGAFVMNVAGWVWRWIESYQMGYGHIPLSNMYEALITVSWCIVLVFLVMEKKYQTKILGCFVFPIVSLTMAFASLSPKIPGQIEPLIPALQSNWLTYHVLTCFLGYAAFTVAFGMSIAFLIKRKGGGEKIGRILEQFPDTEVMEDMIYKANGMGFLFLGLGIITGSVWANYAWGSYWSWDPKETWSLITWLIYAVYLHARLLRGWKGEKAVILSIVGYGAVLFTFLGVNYLLSGLHTYTS